MATGPAASCINTDSGCVVFDCVQRLWDWIDPPTPHVPFHMENKKTSTTQPISQQHLMVHHVHPDQIYAQQSTIPTHVTTQPSPIQPNGAMHQHQMLHNQYHPNINPRSPLLENRHELYGTGHNHDYTRHYGANDNYNYPQSPPRIERSDLHIDHNVNHDLIHNIPKGYNAEVYQDYMKRNPPKETNQIYQNHQSMHRPNVNHYGSKPYLPFSNRLGPQSNTELLKRQYNEIQQMKLQQQMHYQNQAQMHQQQKFAERQLLLQQIHGIQPPPNLQNSIYSEGSYRDLDRYSSRNDFKEYSSTDIQKDVDRYAKNNEYKEMEKQTRPYQESQWQSNAATEYTAKEGGNHPLRSQPEGDSKSQSPPSDNIQKNNNVGVVSPMKSSTSSSPSAKSPLSESRRSSGGNQALRSPIAQRIPSAPVTMSGILYKQGSDGLKVWRKRWFVLSEYCLFYYKSQEEEKLLGSVLLPSYKVSACTAEDKVLRKHAFKLEHANMRTYVLAAPDQEAMLKWVKALTMAALMQSPNEQQERQGERTAAKTEDGDDIPGPTYANAPPKPRRSNEGYNSPSPDMYDPNYDLLKKPASHYSQSPSHTRREHTSYPTGPNQETTYNRSPQSPPPPPGPAHFQTKRSYDTHHLSLPLTNTVTERLENNHNQPSTSMYKTNHPLTYYDNRNRSQQQQQPETNQEQIYEPKYDRQSQSQNPFLHEMSSQSEITPSDVETPQNNIRTAEDTDRKSLYDSYSETRNTKSNADLNIYNKDGYGELNTRPVNRAGIPMNERLRDRRTPDSYGQPQATGLYNKQKDYEDVYNYGTEKEYGRTYHKQLPNIPQQVRDAAVAAVTANYKLHSQDSTSNYSQEKTFSGPAVLRRKKMQNSGVQSPMLRPHSADFLEYESRNEMLNKTAPARNVNDPPRQPQRPKSSLDINSYYDPSSDRYYSEESYAEKMRQSAQYLQQGLGSRNIQIPLAKYASGLAEKQVNSAYSQITNNNYDTELGGNMSARDDINYTKRYAEALNSNWTLKEKSMQDHRDAINRSGSVISDGSTFSGVVKEVSRVDATEFMRSASARCPSSTNSNAPETREESMKRLLQWKQRMLLSPLTRKSTPAAISLARSLNQKQREQQSTNSAQMKPKPKSFTNASYTSYSSDDEEETSGTELQKPRDMQAGRSHKTNITSPIIMRPITPYATAAIQTQLENSETPSYLNIEAQRSIENTYENILCSKNDVQKTPDTELELQNEVSDTLNDSKSENEPDGYETNDSEAESETQIEYTDNNLDEALLQSDSEVQTEDEVKKPEPELKDEATGYCSEICDDKPQTPPVRPHGEDHYLPMSPRKASMIEPAHKTILQNLSVFDQTRPLGHEDNPYVEMNVGNEEEDMQTYEIVCVNNGKVEPVYMELNNLFEREMDLDEALTKNKFMQDTASNFADTKDQTLKRVSKNDKVVKEKSDCSDADDETSKDISLDVPFSRFSISDTFRPASYYLGSIRKIGEVQDSSDSDILSIPLTPHTPPPNDELSGEALSKYILEKLDNSDLSQDSSILKLLTSENQNMNTVKRKTTSLMIYGSRTSIHDTLSRGEKIRNSRASLTNEKKLSETSTPNLLSNSILEHYNSSSIETDSLRSYNADRGSSRLSLESDVSSKFEMAPSNLSSEVTSLNESESTFDLRYPSSVRDTEMMIKRRPLSDDSIFELTASGEPIQTEITPSIDLDRYLDNLQPSTSSNHKNHHWNSSTHDVSELKDNMLQAALQTVSHARCSSTPISNSNRTIISPERYEASMHHKHICEEITSYRLTTPNSDSCVGMPKSPMAYYCKTYDEEKLLSKNLNCDVLSDKIKEFECEKVALKSGTETNTSSSTTGFHSRESSTEQSAPYYYSDLSSQEHINVLPTSHYLKNTNLHRKLNNQRRRGPLHKKNEISHIHNPIHNNQAMTDRSFELVTNTRSVSVEFLSAADKDPEIDLKNIYESTGNKFSKIPESMSLISSLGCKRSSSNSNGENSPESNVTQVLNTSSSLKVSNASMSSHCSENSSNTVYYDAEAEVAGAYENVICQGEKHWDEDALWRDNLRRVSHRHARSMDDLDFVPASTSLSGRVSVDVCGMNSIKRVKKTGTKINRNVTYVNCEFQNQILRLRDNSSLHNICPEEEIKADDNDVYVSLAENAEVSLDPSDEGVYEQLAVDSTDNSLGMQSLESEKFNVQGKRRRRFEIDREKLRQWDLMSSGLMKGGTGCVRGAVAGLGTGTGGALCSTNDGIDGASNQASMSVSTKVDLGANNISNQQTLSKKSFVGSNTSIGRNNRDANIPVRAVSPRVRWTEDKHANEQNSLQQLSASQQNLHTLNPTEDSWMTNRSPLRSQQPIRAVSPRVRRITETDDLQRDQQGQNQGQSDLSDVPSAGELLGHTHEELVLLLIQLRRRHAATHRAIEQCCSQITRIEDCMSSLKAMEREESLQRLESLKEQLMDLESQYEKSKPLVQLVDNMVKLGSLYNRPGSTVERLERNQRLRQKVLTEHALEQQRWLESAAAGLPLETEAARVRVAELWALEQELADEAAVLQGLRIDKNAIESLLSGVRGKLDSVKSSDYPPRAEISPALTPVGIEAELARVHNMLAHNSKKLEKTVADNARLERELQQLRRALQARRAAPLSHAHVTPTALLEDEVSRVQQLVTDLQLQRQELSRAVRHLTQQSQTLQSTQDSMPGKRRPLSSWQETNLDTGHTIDHGHGHSDYDYEMAGQVLPPGHYQMGLESPLYVDTRAGADVTSPLNSEDMQHSAFGNLSNVEKQEIKTVRIVKRESERRQRDRERSLQPMSDWPSNNLSLQPLSDWQSNNVTSNLDHFLEEEFAQTQHYSRSASLPRQEFSDFKEYYSKPSEREVPNYLRFNDKSLELSPKFPSSPSLSNFDYSRDLSVSLGNSYHKSYDTKSTYKPTYDRAISLSTQLLSSPTDSAKTLTNEPLLKTSSIMSLTRSNMELSPIFKSEAAKQIITEMSEPKNGSLHRRQVPKEKRRHYTAPHHLSAKTLSEMPKDVYGHDKMGRSLDDADMERALRTGAAPDVVRSSVTTPRYSDSIDQLLAAPQKILIPERYIPEKPPELSPEEQQKRQEKVESIKKMLSSSSADPNSKSPDGEEKRQREHLLQMNQILAKQVTEMSKIIAVKALEELPRNDRTNADEDHSPEVELPIYQQRENFFS